MSSPEKELSFVFGNSVVKRQTPHILPEDAEAQEHPEYYLTETLCLSRTQLKHVADSILKNSTLKVSLDFICQPLPTYAAGGFKQEISHASSTLGQQFWYIIIIFLLMHYRFILIAHCVIFSIYILKATTYPVSQIQCLSACPTSCGWTSEITKLHRSLLKLACTGRRLMQLLFEMYADLFQTRRPPWEYSMFLCHISEHLDI